MLIHRSLAASYVEIGPEIAKTLARFGPVLGSFGHVLTSFGTASAPETWCCGEMSRQKCTIRFGRCAIRFLEVAISESLNRCGNSSRLTLAPWPKATPHDLRPESNFTMLFPRISLLSRIWKRRTQPIRTRTAPRFRPVVEGLETRDVPAITLSVALSNSSVQVGQPISFPDRLQRPTR